MLHCKPELRQKRAGVLGAESRASPEALEQRLVACVGAATLLQINDPIKEHTHADSDEFVYVLAGEGNAHIGRMNSAACSGVSSVIGSSPGNTVARMRVRIGPGLNRLTRIGVEAVSAEWIEHVITTTGLLSATAWSASLVVEIVRGSWSFA